VPAYDSTVATDGRKGDITFGGTKCFVAFYVVTLGAGKKTALISIGGLPVTVSTDKLHEWAVTDPAELQTLKEQFYDNGRNRRYDPPEAGHATPQEQTQLLRQQPDQQEERPCEQPQRQQTQGPQQQLQHGQEQRQGSTRNEDEIQAQHPRHQPEQVRERLPEQQQQQQPHGLQQPVQHGQHWQEERQTSTLEEHDSSWNDADWPIGTSPPLSAAAADRLKMFLATYSDNSGAPLRTGPLNGASTATTSTPPGAAPSLRPAQMGQGEMGRGGCGTHGRRGNGEVDGEGQAKPRRKKTRGGAAADGDTDGGRKRPKFDETVASLLAAVYEDKHETMQAVLSQLKVGHAGKIVDDTAPSDAVVAVIKTFKSELRALSHEICTMLNREGVAATDGGLKHALLNSGAAIQAIHGTLVEMGAPEAEQKVYSSAIEKLIVGNHDAAAKVVWDDVKRVQSAAAKRMARVATDVGKVLRDRMTGRVGVVAHAPTREANVNAYLTLLMEMREADEMMHGAGVLPAWLRMQIFWALVPGAGNRYGGHPAADIAQASRQTTFAPQSRVARNLAFCSTGNGRPRDLPRLVLGHLLSCVWCMPPPKAGDIPRANGARHVG